MKGDKDAILHFKPSTPSPTPDHPICGLELEKFAQTVRLETRKDCLARIQGHDWMPGEIDEVSDGHCGRSFIIDPDTLIRVLGLGMAR